MPWPLSISVTLILSLKGRGNQKTGIPKGVSGGLCLKCHSEAAAGAEESVTWGVGERIPRLPTRVDSSE